jgi:hypothetical protein
MQPVLGCDLDERGNTTRINIIGCSNLNYNIEMSELRKRFTTVGITKYEFSGALNSVYLKYLISKIKATGNNDKYVVYFPTDIFFKQNTFPHDEFFYHFGISKDFLLFTFNENRMILLSENWRKVYKSVAALQYPDYKTVFRNLKNDKGMDSLINNKTSYSECNLPFNRKKHIVRNPVLTETDAANFNHIFGKENYIIVNTPIPNISEHAKYNYTVFEKNGFNKPLDSPDSIRYDSTLFYDQWLHLNKCGRIIETQKMIREIEKLKLER